METVIGVLLIVVLPFILTIAHYTQVTAEQLKSLNSKIDEFMRTAKGK